MLGMFSHEEEGLIIWFSPSDSSALNCFNYPMKRGGESARNIVLSLFYERQSTAHIFDCFD